MSEFKVSTNKYENVTVVRTEGYLDDVGGKRLKEVCEHLISNGDVRLVFDLSKTPVINSTGLSMILDIVVKAVDYNDGKVAIIGLTKLTKSALQMTGVLTICEAFDNEQEAIEAVKS